MSSAEVVAMQQPSLASRLAPVLAVVAAVALAVIVAAALWPQDAVLGADGTLRDAQQMANQLRALSALRPGQAVNLSIDEAAVNGYISHYKLQTLNLKALRTSFRQDRIRIRAVKGFGPYRVARFELEPKFSVELVCEPYGGGLRTVGARVGHLHLPQPLAAPVERFVRRTAASQREWPILRQSGSVSVGDGTVTLSVSG